MGLLCQHFRVLVPLMSAPLEQSINPNTGAINVYSLLEFTASMVPISGLWPTQSKAVNEWQFIESPSTGRSMPSAGTDEDSKATAKGNPEAIILISVKEYKNIADHMNELSEEYFILILSLTPLDGHPFKNSRRRQRNRQREIEKDFPLWLLIYRQRTDRDVSSSPPVYSCLNLNNFGFCFCYTPDTYKNCLPLGFHNSGLSFRFSTKIESLNPLLWRFVGCRRHTHRRWFRGSLGHRQPSNSRSRRWRRTF